MKRVLALLLVLTMVLTFAACGEDKKTGDEQTTTTTIAQSGNEWGGDVEDDIVMNTTTTTAKKTNASTTDRKGTGTTVSQAQEPRTISPKKNIKLDKEYVSADYETVSDTMVSAYGIMIQNGGPDGLLCVRLEAMFESDASQLDDGTKQRKPLTYQGKKYYRIGGGQSPYRVELTNIAIIIKQSFYEQKETVTARLEMLANGDLKVTETYVEWLKVGQVLSINNNYLN